MLSTDGNVYETQKKQTLSVDFPLGVRFLDEGFAEQPGVSRFPVREAICRDGRLILIGSLGISPTEKRSVGTPRTATFMQLEKQL
jgi:hypothetical protein